MNNQDRIETLQTLFDDIIDDAQNGSQADDTRKMREYLESIEATVGELKKAIK